MKQRCCNPNNPGYEYYGGRGITVCKNWRENFEIFYADVGDPPDNLSFDRIDNNGNYEPGNWRWGTSIGAGRQSTARDETQRKKSMSGRASRQKGNRTARLPSGKRGRAHEDH
jgi:hypothetical protein